MGRAVAVGGVPAEELADRFGTPLYAYDAAVIRRRWDLLTGAFRRRPEVLYSCKANAVLGIVRLIHGLGAGVDACSPGDLVVAQHAGVPADRVSYVGCSASDADLRAVRDAGVFFTADSLSQLERFGALHAPAGAEIGLRVNVDVAAGFHGHVQAGAWDAKFGLATRQLREALRVAAGHRLRVVGLHSHVGSDILDPQAHLTLLDRLLELAPVVPDLRFINVGGGWGTPFLAGDEEYPTEAFARAVEQRLARAERVISRDIELRLEPGAYLVMDAGVLLTRVTEIKQSVAIGDQITPAFLGVDSSYNHVVSAVIYDTYHPIELARAAGVEPVDGTPYHVVGNLMQAGDVIARSRRIPGDVCPGDVLVVHKCGGYSSSRSTCFNERPRPAEVLVDGTTVTMLRRRETAEDLVRLDA
jgi:diaminopimelate decarboxylase